MANLKLLISITFLLISLKTIQSRDLIRKRPRRENQVTVCDAIDSSNEVKVQCFCKNMFLGNTSFPYRADCWIAKTNIPIDDDIWTSFSSIQTVEELLLSSKGENIITYIPTSALKALRELLTVTIRFGRIHNVPPYAFGNATNVHKIKLAGNEIQTLSVHAFAHHPNLTSITLDQNRITEIKRNVFKRLPQLQELFMTSNNISVIHDRAFMHLSNLVNLELEKNSIFVLTNETFLGLVNLTQLDLRDNNLQVIGDNTFATLMNLRSLNLEKNNIKMLDDKAFHGANSLESLSLGYNKLTELTNSRVFTALTSLKVLDLKANGMKLLAPEVIAPIMHNFYSDGTSIGFEDNQFPCDCNLNWFLTLKNHTKNQHLEETIDNLMCYPSEELTEDLKNYEENEKSKTEEDPNTAAAAEFDYYDESSLAGRKFFIDIPSTIVPCDRTATGHTGSMHPVIPNRSTIATRLSNTTPQTTIVRSQERTTRIYHEIPTTTMNSIPTPSTSKQTRPTYVVPKSQTYHEHRFTVSSDRDDVTTSPHRPETTPTRRYTPVARELHPTEDIMKDAFETTARTTTTPRILESSKFKKAVHSPWTTQVPNAETPKLNDLIPSRVIVKEESSPSSDPTETVIYSSHSPPESASHVHVSKASLLLHSKMLSFAIASCLVLGNIRVL